MKSYGPERLPGVLSRIGDSVRDAMKRLPDLEEPEISRLENEGGIVLEDEEPTTIPPTGSPELEEIARFVGEGGLPKPPEE